MMMMMMMYCPRFSHTASTPICGNLGTINTVLPSQPWQAISVALATEVCYISACIWSSSDHYVLVMLQNVGFTTQKKKYYGQS